MAVAVAALGGLLREAPARALFAKSGGVALLAPLLRAGSAGGPGAPGSQLLYEAGLALWQLSFYQPAAAAMGSAGVLPGLVELARTAPKEKARPTLTLNPCTACLMELACTALKEKAWACHAWADKRGSGLLGPASSLLSFFRHRDMGSAAGDACAPLAACQASIHLRH